MWGEITNGKFDARAMALKATRAFFAQIDVKAIESLRKELDLPPEALGTLIEIYSRELDKGKPPIPAPSREVLPLSTGEVLVKPGQTAEITARPQRVSFRPERLFVSDASSEYKGPWWKRLSPWYKAPQPKGASDWIINDIKIGNRSQFAQAGDIPADMFRSSAIDSFVSFETAQVAMDIKLVVTYVGPNRRGERFFASMVGTAVI